MQTFIAEVILKVRRHYGSLENLTFVLPSKRAGNFLREEVAKSEGKTILAPSIYSIEQFIERISGYSYANQNQLLFKLYEAYLSIGHYEKEPFRDFMKWGGSLLQDFNEIDRYLVDAKSLYDNLSAIEEINHWSVQPHKTTLMANYLAFWHQIYPIYKKFSATLLAQGIGYQGLIYRKAHENLKNYTRAHSEKYIFLGFNALNTAEQQIIHYLLQHTESKIYWDIDPYFLNDPVHDAGYFIRSHFKTWCLKTDDSVPKDSSYLGKKHIEIIGVPKNVAQAKYASEILNKLSGPIENDHTSVALVLGEESLLGPVLNAVPANITALNITMGQRLDLAPVASYMLQFLHLLASEGEKGWYHHDLLAFLTHPFSRFFGPEAKSIIQGLSLHIAQKNLIYISRAMLGNCHTADHPLLKSLLSVAPANPLEIVAHCQQMVLHLKNAANTQFNALHIEQLYRLWMVFNNLKDMLLQYPYVEDVDTLISLYRQLVALETLDFEGNPMQGLQIMGMLESRNLDFETVVITSVNEGVLPAGKTQNSFIPFDLKKRFGLPTYKEKDAVYTYHFYRLLQRAKNIYLLYNTEPDTLEGGEKSRLLLQLQTDEHRQDIIERIAHPTLQSLEQPFQVIEKKPALLTMIATKATKGLSPSSLGSYIKNPIEFYKQHILGIKETALVEETIAANTFGTVVHDSLEELYTPFLGKYLSKELLKNASAYIRPTVAKHYEKTYASGRYATGKNYISLHVIQKYVQNFINLEIAELDQHRIKIKNLEEELHVTLEVPGIAHPIVIKGKLDRVDEYNGETRIIDYKTGKVARTDLAPAEWGHLVTEKKYSKAFQLLCYAYMYHKRTGTPMLRAGIVSFKNLSDGILYFGTKAATKATPYGTITAEVLNHFEEQLFLLLKEIHDPGIPFAPKQV